jgi:hypothetical protein
MGSSPHGAAAWPTALALTRTARAAAAGELPTPARQTVSDDAAWPIAPAQLAQPSSSRRTSCRRVNSPSRALAALASLTRWRSAPPLTVTSPGNDRRLVGRTRVSQVVPLGCRPARRWSIVTHLHRRTERWTVEHRDRATGHLVCVVTVARLAIEGECCASC